MSLAFAFIFCGAYGIFKHAKGDEMLAVQSGIILFSVLLLLYQAKQARNQQVSDADDRKTDASDRAHRDTLSQLTHTTTDFRQMERAFLHELIMFCKNEKPTEEENTPPYQFAEEPLRLTLRNAYCVYVERLHKDHGEAFDENMLAEADKRDSTRFLDLMRGRNRGIESVTHRQARMFNGCFTTQSYLREMLTQYELLGVGIFQGAFSFGALNDAVGTQIVDAFLRWENFIYEHRRRPRKRRVFNYFQLLASLVVHSRAIELLFELLGVTTKEELQKRLESILKEAAGLEGARVDEKLTEFESRAFKGRQPNESERYWLRQASRSCFRPFAATLDDQTYLDLEKSWNNLKEDGEKTLAPTVYTSSENEFIPDYDTDVFRPLLIDPKTALLRKRLPKGIKKTIEWACHYADEPKREQQRCEFVEVWWYSEFMQRYNGLTYSKPLDSLQVRLNYRSVVRSR